MTRLLLWRGAEVGPYPIPEEPPDPTSPTPPSVTLPDYAVWVEESDGTKVTRIPKAACRKFRLEADGIGTAEYEVPFGAQGLLQLVQNMARTDSEGVVPNLYGGRVALYRDGIVVHRGPVTAWDTDTVRSIHTITVGEAHEDLTGIVVGDAERTNWFTGGDFEGGLPSGTNYAISTPTIVTSPVARGDQAMRVDGGIAGGYRAFVVNLPVSTTQRNLWHVSGHIYVPTGQAWPFGITVRPIHDGVGQNVTYQGLTSAEDEDATGRFVRLEVPTIVCPLGLATFQLSIYCHAAPSTQPVYDEIRVSRNDSESVAEGGDVAQMPSTLAQAAITKGSLGWTRKAWPAGVTLDDGFRYPHSEHANTWSAMTDEQWLADVSMYFRHDRNQLWIGPRSRLGRNRRDLQIGPRTDGGSYGGSIRPPSWDGSQVVTAAIALGEASDSVTREEAGYDSGAGPPREYVEAAPDGTALNRLDHYARQLVADLGDARGTVPIILDRPRGGRTSADWLRKGVHVLDRIRVRTVADPIDVSGWYEIVAIEVTPSDGDHMTIETVPV